MKKRVYHAINIKDVKEEKIREQVRDKRIVFGIDVAKEDFFAVIRDYHEDVIQTIKWKSPTQVREVIEFLTCLPVKQIEAAMEPSGTYGDALRELLESKGIAVFQVNAKRSHDAAEVYDGVPSLHDAKSAAIIAKLHIDGKSQRWKEKTDKEREYGAAIELMDIFDDQYRRNLNRLESKLSRYWPELSTIIDLDSATLLGVIEEFGCPCSVRTNEEKSLAFMKKIGKAFLSNDKIELVIKSARDTIGAVMKNCEIELMKELAKEINRNRKMCQQEKTKLEKQVESDESARAISQIVGKMTAAILIETAGDPKNYSSANGYVKKIGLNLKEKSSGKHKGKVKITKRGGSKTRKYLYLCVLRMIQRDEVFGGWYNSKVARDGGKVGVDHNFGQKLI